MKKVVLLTPVLVVLISGFIFSLKVGIDKLMSQPIVHVPAQLIEFDKDGNPVPIETVDEAAAEEIPDEPTDATIEAADEAQAEDPEAGDASEEEK